jgi:hypothetical protein
VLRRRRRTDHHGQYRGSAEKFDPGHVSLLIIDPPTWAVGDQDCLSPDNIPGSDESIDHASAILTAATTRALDRRAPAARNKKY